jgi:hypothetical protein
VDSTSGYALLQKSLPIFLQLVATDPGLHVERPNGSLVISFPRVINGARHELRRFVTYDTIGALLLGVPSLVEYAYDGEFDSETPGFDWVHGIPAALIKIVAQVNSYRAGSIFSVNNWETLERRTWAWKSQRNLLDASPDSQNVNQARDAVQEGWRHLLLIYIYMVRLPPSLFSLESPI